MPVRYRLWPEFGTIVVRPVGVLTEQCMLTYFKEVWEDPAWQPGLNRLIDNRDMTDIDMTYAQMRNLRANEKPPPAGQVHPRIAVFVCPEDIGYGMARMYKSIGTPSGDETVHLVETLAEAMAILRIDPVHLSKLEAV